MPNKSNAEVLGEWASEPLSIEDKDALVDLYTEDLHTVDEQSEALSIPDVRTVINEAGARAIEQALKNADEDEKAALEDHWTTPKA